MASSIRRARRTRYPRQKESGCSSSATPLCVGMAILRSSNSSKQYNNETWELLESIRSLYADQLEPLDIHVRRRIEEATGKRWTPERLLEVGRRVDSISIEEEKGNRKRWLFLVSETRDFVDQSSPHDPYPKGAWQAMKDFVAAHKSDWSNLCQASSRYDIGKMLRDTMPELQCYSLGQVCHMVQLAVKLHHLLGYRDGRIVPYQESFDFEKLSNAKGNQPTGVEETETVVSNKDELYQKLSILLALPAYSQGIQISSLKALMRKHFSCELNETVLGHTKLSALLRDPHFSNLSTVRAPHGTEMYLQVRSNSATEVKDSARKKRRLKNDARQKHNEPRTSASADLTKVRSCIADHKGLHLLQSSPRSRKQMPEYRLSSSGSPVWTLTNNSAVMFKDTVVYEPVVHWVPRVVRTFIEYQMPEHERGCRREKSCPARVEGDELARVASPNSGRANSEPVHSSTVEEEEDECISTMDSMFFPNPYAPGMVSMSPSF